MCISGEFYVYKYLRHEISRRQGGVEMTGAIANERMSKPRKIRMPKAGFPKANAPNAPK